MMCAFATPADSAVTQAFILGIMPDDMVPPSTKSTASESAMRETSVDLSSKSV